MKRFKSYALWAAVVSFIGLILGNYGLYDIIGMTTESYQQIANSLLSVLVLAGIINNPTSGTGYKDK